MALCRCKTCGTRSYRYIKYAEPVGYPKTSSICGRANCLNPGVVFLKKEEVDLHLSGQRTFSFDSNVTKVRVKDDLFNYK